MVDHESELLMFTGTECEHCHDMYPLIDQLEEETGKKVEKIEVWHHADNAALMENYDPQGSRCGGVPFFFNTKTGKWICGAVNYESLKTWAVGEMESTANHDRKTPHPK